MNRIITFLKEVRTEVSKVTWPTQSQIIKYTLMVLVICLILALYLGGLDAIFKYLIEIFIIK